jgi:hypothetical protein
MSDLRTRIAALLYALYGGRADEPWEMADHVLWQQDADAVIAELAPCWHEWAVESDYKMSRNLFLDKESAAKWMAELDADDPEGQRRLMSRLITDWKEDDE